MRYGVWMKYIMMLLAVYVLNGCGGSVSPDNAGGDDTAIEEAQNTSKEKAYYVDDPIVNVEYHCGDLHGKTDRDGMFLFEPGKGCRFFVAKLQIREINASQLKPEIYVIESDPDVAALLQSLDKDGMQNDRIEIDDEIHQILAEKNITKLPENNAQIHALIETINQERDGAKALQVRDRNQVIARVKASAQKYRSHVHCFTSPIGSDATAAGGHHDDPEEEENSTSSVDENMTQLSHSGERDDASHADENTANDHASSEPGTQGTAGEDGSTENNTSIETNTTGENNTHSAESNVSTGINTPRNGNNERNATDTADENRSAGEEPSHTDEHGRTGEGNITEESNTTEETNTTMAEENNASIETNTTDSDAANATSSDQNSSDDGTSASDDNATEENNDRADDAATLVYTKLNDHLFVNEKNDVAIYIANDINKSEKLIYNREQIKKITRTIYQSFQDDYDFIFLITNNEKKPSTVSYSGVFLKVKNDVEGIGVSLYSHSDQYGSAGKLKGIMHFAYRGAVLRGPTLHEISHYWANKFRVGYTQSGGVDYDSYMIGKSGHWGYMGFFGGKGQLGGFDAQKGDFRVEKDANGSDLTYESKHDGTWKIYSAKDFSWNANGAGRIPYNDLELYLMGFLPKEEVADMLVPLSYGSPIGPETKKYLLENHLTERGRNYFMAREVVRKSWAEIMADHHIPERKPNVQNAQKSFRVLTVLLDRSMPRLHEVNSISAQMEKFTRQGDDGIATNHNFWEATRGLGSLRSDRLDDSLKNKGEEYPVDDDFVSEEITFHGKVYKSIKSPYTGRIWLDRNIGADRVCKSLTDRACYGGYFEFGRGFDGHQLPDSPTTTAKKQSLVPNDNTFVLSDYTTGYDWVVDGVDDNGSKRIAFVNDITGNGVCPAGFRLPSMDELYAETLTNEHWDRFPAQNIENDFLKLPLNGYRNAQHTKGLVTEKDERGAYWTNTTYLSSGKLRVRHMMFTKDDLLGYGTRYIGNGEGIRCIKVQ